MNMEFPDRNIFGRLPIKPGDLLNRLDKHKWKKRRGYCPDTGELFHLLSELAKSKCLSCYPNSKKNRAFLLDYQWCKEGVGTVLAVESELSAYEIRGFQGDFEKLLYWKSPLKLMIARERRKLPAEQIRKELGKYARGIQQYFKDEVFLLFVFGKQNHAYGYVATGDSNKKFQFTEVTPLNH